jgi:hypothetical protein
MAVGLSSQFVEQTHTWILLVLSQTLSFRRPRLGLPSPLRIENEGPATVRAGPPKSKFKKFVGAYRNVLGAGVIG